MPRADEVKQLALSADRRTIRTLKAQPQPILLRIKYDNAPQNFYG
jgi:hypothetical protein